MDIQRINSTLTKAILSLQESELESLHERAKKSKRKRKRKGKGWIKKVIGKSPDDINPLDPGSGIKGFIGRTLHPM